MRLIVRVGTNLGASVVFGPHGAAPLCALPDLVGKPVAIEFAQEKVVARVIARFPSLHPSILDLCLYVEDHKIVNEHVLGIDSAAPDENVDSITNSHSRAWIWDNSAATRYTVKYAFVSMICSVHRNVHDEISWAFEKLLFVHNSKFKGARRVCVVRDDCAWTLPARYNVHPPEHAFDKISIHSDTTAVYRVPLY